MANVTAPYVFREYKPVYTISVAEAQKEFENAMLVAQNALKELLEADDEIKKMKVEISQFDATYKDLGKNESIELKTNFTNKLKNMTASKEKKYNDYK